MMSGLVGEMNMLVLPSIPPLLTVVLTLLTWMVSIYHGNTNIIIYHLLLARFSAFVVHA